MNKKGARVLGKLLVITNMGPKPTAPFQGQFVTHQVEALAAVHPSYFFMQWHSDSLLNRLFKYPVFFLRFLIRYVFSRQRFDLLHVHFYYPTIWLALCYKWLRNPAAKIIVTCHGSDVYHYQPPSALYRFAARWVDHWIFTSAQLQQRFFSKVQPATVLCAGIHPVFSQGDVLPWAEKQYDLLYVGTMDHNKGMDRLKTLIETNPTLQFALVGTGPLRSQFETLAQTCANVRLFSPKAPQELAHMYRASRVFLSLSRNESFGLVMTEAMACGTPVIATETDGSKAQIREGQTGYLVSQADEDELMQSLQARIHQLFSLGASEYAQWQWQCREQAATYSLPAVAKQLTTIYQATIQAPLE